MRPLITLLLCCIAPALLAAPPERIEASYDLLSKGIRIAVVTEKFTRTGDHYRIESFTKPVGLLALFRSETYFVVSEGDITAQGLRPKSFVYKRSKEVIKNSAANFDWQKSILMYNDRDGHHSEPLPTGLQDRLSMLYQFGYVPLLHERKELSMHITNGSKIDNRQYLVRSKQVLTVPLGSLETLYLSTAPQQTPWKTEIWLAIEKGNLPCKIVLTEDNGEILTQVLTALSINQ